MPPKSKPKAAGMSAAEVRFADVIEGAVYTRVDPMACIPFTRVRKISRSGVLRLKRIFSGSSKAAAVKGRGKNFDTTGYVAGSDTAIIVPLVGTFAKYVVEYFAKEKGITEAEATEHSKTRDDWYGIVEGHYRHVAILELITELPEVWQGFMWPVMKLKGGHSMQVLKQLARHQNMRHSDKFFVETTLYDHLRGLKDEASRLSRANGGKRPSGKEVADAYDGCADLKDRTIQQMATTAMRLSDDVIEAIGDVVTAEHPDLVDTSTLDIGVKNLNTEEVMELADCRVYRKFLNITSVKSATAFMQGGDEDAVISQVNAIFRCREICRFQAFKPISFKTVLEQYSKATLALRECRKFEEVIESTKWPSEMESTRMNLLQNTKFDSEVEFNAGNDHEVLEVLLNQYLRVCPGVASVKIDKYKAARQKEAIKNEDGTGDVVAEKGDGNRAETSIGGVETGFDALLAVEKEVETFAAKPGSAEQKDSTVLNMVSSAEEQTTDANTAICDSEQDATSNLVSEGKSTAASNRLLMNGSGGEISTDPLGQLNIQCHQMKWQEYDKFVVTSDTPQFDLVLTDPPYGVPPNAAGAGSAYDDYLDDEHMRGFTQFCRRVIVPGGYCFLFTSMKYFLSWVKYFRETGFRAPEYPFVVNKDTSRMQVTRLEHFPQNCTEFAVMAKCPGKSKKDFKPDFTSPFNLFQCKQKRKFASVLNVPAPNRKLTNGSSKAPLLTEEKNSDLLAEIMTTFCPMGGSVLDCYAGTMTTAIAAMLTGRPCTVVESDVERFRYAKNRLFMVSENFIEAGESGGQPKRRCVRGDGNDFSQVTGQSITGNTVAGGVVGDGQGELKGGDKVILTLDGRVVGEAVLQEDSATENHVKRSIHNHALSEFEEPDQFLVVIYNVYILPNEVDARYPYTFPTVDVLPQTIGDTQSNGIYVWDMKCMKKKVL